MNKIIISIISSFFFLFVLWNIQAYSMYGDDMVNYHIDVKRTLEVFDKEFMVEDTLAAIEIFSVSITKDLNIDDSVLSSLVNTLTFIVSTFVMIIPLAISLVCDVFQIIITIIDFVFSPKFVRI